MSDDLLIPFEQSVVSLGPLALDVRAVGADGLLLAGDAAGFVDPMTGDGMHIAFRGGLPLGSLIAGPMVPPGPG